MHGVIEILELGQRIAWTVIRLMIQLLGLCLTAPARLRHRHGVTGRAGTAAEDLWDLQLPAAPEAPDVGELGALLRQVHADEPAWPRVPEQPHPPTVMTYGAYLRRRF